MSKLQSSSAILNAAGPTAKEKVKAAAQSRDAAKAALATDIKKLQRAKAAVAVGKVIDQTQAKKAKSKSAPATKKATTAKASVPAAKKDAGPAIAKSWTDKKVRAARLTKNGVKVGGYEYRSVGAAFEDLGLPMGQMIRFRMSLKAAKGRQAKFGPRTFQLLA